MQGSIIFALVCLGVAHATVLPTHEIVINSLVGKEFSVPSPRADMTEWLDEILALLRRELMNSGMDNVPIPNMGFNFSEVILGITWHGEAYIEDGFLKGLETIHRTGEAELTYLPNGDLVVYVDVGVISGTVGAKCTVKFMDLGPVATLSGTIKNIAVRLGLRVQTVDGLAKLETFDIKSLGTLSMDVKGLGLILNFLIKTIVSVFGNLVKNVVAMLLEGVIKSIINSILANMSGLSVPPSVQSYANVQNFPVIVPRVFPIGTA